MGRRKQAAAHFANDGKESVAVGKYQLRRRGNALICSQCGSLKIWTHFYSPCPSDDAYHCTCLDCGAIVPLGPSNDRISIAETRLAELLAEIPQLWEPRSQGEAMEIAIDDCASWDTTPNRGESE